MKIVRKMTGRLEGRVVVVTGGAMGIGKATAIAAAKEGTIVAVCDLNEAEGRRTVEEIKAFEGKAKILQARCFGGGS